MRHHRSSSSLACPLNRVRLLQLLHLFFKCLGIHRFMRDCISHQIRLPAHRSGGRSILISLSRLAENSTSIAMTLESTR